MKWLVCEKLAPSLRIRVPAKTSKPSVVCTKDSNDAGDFQRQPREMVLGTTDKLLTEIRDLLQAKIRSEAEDEGDKNKSDWKLAAVVFDRIFLITFSILHVGGTVTFAVIFVFVYRSHF